MVKKSSPIEKTARLLDLVPYISTHQGISIQDLAREFSVSPDELISDLNSLWMCGLPGYTPLELIDLEFESGFVTIRNAETLNLARSLSQQEMIALKLGLDILTGDIERQDLLEEVAALQALLAPHISVAAIADSAASSATESVIDKAISQRAVIEISYSSTSDDAISHRTVSPIDVYAEGPHRYLRAFCHNAQSGRTFRVDRITAIRVTDTEIRVNENRDLNSTDSQMDSSDEGVTLQVKLHRDIRRNREALGAAILAGESTVKVKALNAGWLLRTVMAGAGSCEVLANDPMRQRIKAEADKALALYALNSADVR
jgi:proteasome accessory factor C